MPTQLELKEQDCPELPERVERIETRLVKLEDKIDYIIRYLEETQRWTATSESKALLGLLSNK